jgi:hypothetical protein
VVLNSINMLLVFWIVMEPVTCTAGYAYTEDISGKLVALLCHCCRVLCFMLVTLFTNSSVPIHLKVVLVAHVPEEPHPQRSHQLYRVTVKAYVSRPALRLMPATLSPHKLWA